MRSFLSTAIRTIVLTLLLTAGPSALAGSMFTSDASAKLTLTGIAAVNSNYTLHMVANQHASNTTTILGNALADRDYTVTLDADDVNQVVVGDSIFLDMHAEGSSSAPYGDAFASQRVDGEFLLVNLTGDEIVLSFDYEYDYGITSSEDLPPLDDAGGDATLNLHTHSGVLSQGINSTFDSGTGSGAFSLTYTLPGTTTTEVNVHMYVRARGRALSVPEPGTWLLLGIGSLMLVAGRRWRRPGV